MTPPSTLSIIHDARGVARVTFARAEVHNAFDETMIRELIETFRDLGQDERVRAIVLAA
ncbi:MAG: enoyl-CoA hydratase-related protein, partial [Casimicrobiaceae bacterium]|nr:enoyl-CoA hydratase-related protein [Casimicrobiaceae bacterium]